jgi:hypothetical protein
MRSEGRPGSGLTGANPGSNPQTTLVAYNLSFGANASHGGGLAGNAGDLLAEVISRAHRLLVSFPSAFPSSPAVWEFSSRR